MKITTLLGSANKKGNTATALGWVEAELASLGHEVERVTLNNKSISLVTNYHQPGHTSLMNGKRVALLVTGGDAFEQNAEGMFTAFERFSDFLLAKKQGGLYLGNGCAATLPHSRMWKRTRRWHILLK
jgi:hypothetical protein